MSVLVLWLLLWWPLLAEAETRYVDQGCANGLTTYNPTTRSCTSGSSRVYNTIANGIAAMVANETLYVRAGTYTLSAAFVHHITNPPSGSGGNYTVISAYPGDARPNLRAADPGAQHNYAFLFDQAGHHVEINGFDMGPLGKCGILDLNSFTPSAVGEHHIRLINNLCHDTGSHGINIYMRTTAEGDHVFSGNTFYRIGANYPTPPYVPGHNTFYGTGSRTIIENNVFHDSSDGVAVYNSYNASNLSSLGLSSVPTSDNVVIRNNVFYNMGRTDLNPWSGPGLGNKDVLGLYTGGTNFQVYNNIIYDSWPTNAAIAVASICQATCSGPSNSKIYNNTLYNNSNYAVGLIGYWNGGGGAHSGTHEVRNNISYLNSGSFVGNPAGATVTQSNNATTATNPNFLNLAGRDFHLTSSSACCIDTGTGLTSVFNTDFEGNVRGNGSGAFWDIGADELGGDNIAPAPPTGVSIT